MISFNISANFYNYVIWMVWRLRIIIFYSIIGLVTIVFFVLFCLPLTLLNTSYNFRYKIAVVFSFIFINLLWVILGIKYKVEGLEKLPKDKKPYLVIANHQSFWENFFMQLIIPKHSWVIKKELYNIPVFGWGLRMLQPIAVDRNNNHSIIQILNEGQQKIAEGLSIIFFPEATRIKITRPVLFKPSAAKLALTTQVPVILIAHNAGLFWPKGWCFTRPGTIRIRIIKIINTEEMKQYEVRSLTLLFQEIINREKELLLQEE